jgi:thiol peroxidase
VGHRRFAGAVLLVALSVAGCVKLDAGNHDSGVKSLLQVGSRLPDSLLTQSNGKMVRLNDPTGRVKLISIVPTLNTVISESQTRHISEALPALNGVIERVTVSAIGAEEQERFAKQATIQNMVFLSDAPHFAFGTATGLWLPKEQRLQRAVIVANRENVVQYFELVPTAQFPNYDRLYQVVRRTVAQP